MKCTWSNWKLCYTEPKWRVTGSRANQTKSTNVEMLESERKCDWLWIESWTESKDDPLAKRRLSLVRAERKAKSAELWPMEFGLRNGGASRQSELWIRCRDVIGYGRCKEKIKWEKKREREGESAQIEPITQTGHSSIECVLLMSIRSRLRSTAFVLSDKQANDVAAEEAVCSADNLIWLKRGRRAGGKERKKERGKLKKR